MQAMPVDCQVDGPLLVHHPPVVQAHVVLARWLDVWGALGARSLGRPPVQAPRNVERAVPHKGLGDINLEENLRGCRQQHPAHRPAG